jgi:hypothetical protein
MRIYADINRVGSNPNDFVVQVAPTPRIGTQTNVNGKFFIDVPEGVPVPDPLPTSLTDLTDAIYDGLLSLYPRYGFIHYNPLLTGSDSGKLDPTAVFPYDFGPPLRTWEVRSQLGRFGAPSDNGLAPNGVKVFSQNSSVVPARPGLVVTDTIDISTDVPAGVTDVMLHWCVTSHLLSADVMSYVSGTNTPAMKSAEEVTQDPTSFEAYVSMDDGASYQLLRRMVPFTSMVAGTHLRLAFVNRGNTPITLVSYALMY